MTKMGACDYLTKASSVTFKSLKLLPRFKSSSLSLTY